MMESSSQPQPLSQPQPQVQTTGGFWRWLGRPVNILLVVVAISVLAVIVYRIVWGLSPVVSGDVFGLLGILILIAFLELADVTRYFAPRQQALAQVEDLPPLGVATGTIRALLALLVLGLWAILLLYGPSRINDASLLDRAITAVGSLVLTIVGFYFGSRSTQGKS